MADTLESLEVKVKHSASGADAEVNKLANAITGLKNALKDLPSEPIKNLADTFKSAAGALKGANTAQLTKFAEAMANVAASAELLGANIEHIVRLAESMNAIANVKVTAGSFNAVATGVKNIGEATKAITPESIESLNKIVESLAKLNGVDLRGLGSAMRAVGNSGRSAKPEVPTGPVPSALQEIIRTSNEVDVLTAKLEYLRDALVRAFASGDTEKAYTIQGQILQTEKALEKASSAATQTDKEMRKAAKGIDKVAKSAKKAHKPLSKFFASLERIAGYRLMRTIIKSITQAFSEGLKNAYLFSSGLVTEGHRFAEAMDSMKSASTQMKNQIGSAFIALLTAIEPVVTAIVNLIIKLADAVSQFISAFTGKTYLKAAVVSDKFADDMASGAKSAKEWKNQLLGFDVINRLNEPSNGGGGGGLTPEDMFGGTDTPINEKFLKAVEKIKEFFAGLDTGPLNEAIGKIRDELKPILEKVGDICSWLWDNILAPLIRWVVEKAAPAVGGVVAAILSVVNAIAERLGPVAKQLWDNILKPLFKWIGDTIIKTLNDLSDLLRKLADLISGKTSWKEFWDSLSTSQKWLGIVLTAVALLAGVKGILGLGKAFTTFAMIPGGNVVAILAAIVIGGLLLIQNWDKIKESLTKLGEKWSETWGNGKLEIQDFGYVAIQTLLALMDGVEQAIEGWKLLFEYIGNVKKAGGTTINELGSSHHSGTFGESITGKITGTIANLKDAAAKANGAKITKREIVPKAGGGYVPEGQLFLARERGPELVGSIGNQSAVGNNDQIVEAVSRGVANAVSAVLGRGNNGQEIHIYLDSREIKYGQTRLSRAMGV